MDNRRKKLEDPDFFEFLKQNPKFQPRHDALERMIRVQLTRKAAWEKLAGYDEIEGKAIEGIPSVKEILRTLKIRPGQLEKPRSQEVGRQMPSNYVAAPGITYNKLGFKTKSQAWRLACGVGQTIVDKMKREMDHTSVLYKVGRREKEHDMWEEGVEIENLAGRLVLVPDAEEEVIGKPWAARVSEALKNKEGPVVMGYSPYNLGFRALESRLRRGRAVEWWCYDFSGYDKRNRLEIVRRSFEVIAAMFGVTLGEEFEGRWLAWCCRNFTRATIAMPDGSLFRLAGGVPSGSVFTSVVNSIAAVIYAKIGLARCGLERSAQINVLGDNAVIGLNRHFPHGWKRFRRVLEKECHQKISEKELTVTSSFRSNVWGRGVVFLGRGWSEDGEMWRPEEVTDCALAFPPEGPVEVSRIVARCTGVALDNPWAGEAVERAREYAQWRVRKEGAAYEEQRDWAERHLRTEVLYMPYLVRGGGLRPVECFFSRSRGEVRMETAKGVVRRKVGIGDFEKMLPGEKVTRRLGPRNLAEIREMEKLRMKRELEESKVFELEEDERDLEDAVVREKWRNKWCVNRMRFRGSEFKTWGVRGAIGVSAVPEEEGELISGEGPCGKRRGDDDEGVQLKRYRVNEDGQVEEEMLDLMGALQMDIDEEEEIEFIMNERRVRKRIMEFEKRAKRKFNV